MAEEAEVTGGRDFIRQIIADDLAAGRHDTVVTRFPPEPNGYLHIGHAKSICLNFGVAAEFGGCCYLRFDDTNPLKEEEAYARAIERDVTWLGWDWKERLTHASDYFQRLYDYAVTLIRDGKAYVDGLSADEIRAYRGTLTEPGRPSPDRDRPAEESLDLLERMRRGEFEEGRYVLRAKIDMAAPNMNLRDPTLYRIRKVPHQRTGDAWCIYPMYDFAHSLSDAEEGITHSLCTLEFEDHRPLYDWFIDNLPVPHRPRQIEFSRLNLAYTVTSKRKLNELVTAGHVAGWDDPRMPTLAAMRRRGYPPAAIREFCRRVGVTKKEHTIEMGLLESCVREALNATAPRRLAVIEPLKLVITNYPEGERESLTLPNHPADERYGTREVEFSRVLWIEREDFMEDAPSKYHRLKPDGEVRLRGAYIVRCTDWVRDESGSVVEVHCEYDPETRSGSGSERKVKGTIHWVDAGTGLAAEVRLYDRLFNRANPNEGGDYLANLNPDSLRTVEAVVEPALAGARPGEVFQFERTGYFVADEIDHGPDRLVFNRTVTLRDSWARIERQELAGS
jgi:glutaminyl-tRNA synthetase